jgi:hypothetical protein
MTHPILKITDGTTTVNLINTGNGFLLSDWRPAIAPVKDDGVWQSNSLSDGRRMVLQRWDNVVETFVMHVRNCNQDDTIEQMQDLRRLLQSAVEYWTSEHKVSPVWIEARAPNETNTRYALIYSWKDGGDNNNPFAQPFFGRRSAMRDYCNLCTN